MTYAADPSALQGAVAAGVLGCGTVILGTADLARALIDEVLARIDAGASPDEAAEQIARERRAADKPIAGVRPSPAQAGRSARRTHDRAGAPARRRRTRRRLRDAPDRRRRRASGAKPLPMNVSMAIAATLRDLDVPASLVRGVPILARTAGLIAHLGEEAETPIGFFMASQAEAAIRYVGEDAGRMTHGRARNRSRALGRASRPRRSALSRRRSPISSSARASIATSSRAPASIRPRAVGGLDENRRTAVHRKGRIAPLAQRRRADRDALDRLAATRSCASIRPAARRERRATFR